MIVKNRRLFNGALIQPATALVLLIAAALVTFTCRDDSVVSRSYPVIDTNAVTGINEQGANLHAEILDAGTLGIADHGFVYDDALTPTLANSDRISLGEISGKGPFSAIATRNLVKGKLYHVRAYAITKNNILVYGQITEFLSQGGSAPEFMDFAPTAGVIGDTIILNGSNFSDVLSENRVTFGTAGAQVVKATQTKLWCIVPANTVVGENEVSIRVGQDVIKAAAKFSLLELAIQSVSPEWVTFGDQLTLQVDHLPRTASLVEATVLGKPAAIVSINGSELIVKVSDAVVLTEQAASIKVGLQTKESALAIKLKPPVITSFTPTEAKAGALITIQGTNFNPVKTNQQVLFGAYPAEVVAAQGNTLTVRLPNRVLDEFVNITINVSGQPVTSTDQFHLISAWKKLGDYPGPPVFHLVSWSACGIGYVTLGYKESGYSWGTWKYEPSTDTWSSVASYPYLVTDGTSFVLGCDGYVGFGSNSGNSSLVYQYSPNDDQWIQRSSTPTFRNGAVGWALNGAGYIALGNKGYLNYPMAATLKYNAGLDAWTEVSPFPGELPPSYWSVRSIGFAMNNMGYVMNRPGSGFWKYDPALNAWTQLANFPGSTEYDAGTFSIGGNGYIIGGSSNASGIEVNAILKEFWRYESSSNTWTRLEDFPGIPRQGAAVFTIGDKAYYGLGYGNNYQVLKDFWEFDPSKL